MSDPRSRIPSVDALIASDEAQALVRTFGRERTVDALRDAVSAVRREMGRSAENGDAAGWDDRVEAHATYVSRAARSLETAEIPSLRRVINGTGVVLHTNLGRAPLAAAAVEAMARAAEYANLEYDLDEGVRGSRYVHCVSLLTELTGAEDALVVNNAAGGLVLAVNTLARDAGVAVSRGELVEIGGGFRIPEVLERAGADLVEVGSTNRTRAQDYRDALASEGTAAVLKVHRSNFRITGFTEEASVADLVSVAGEADVPLIHDLGSGLMIDAGRLGVPDEPRASTSVSQGADVVVVSGDKLLGGPQAGIVVGRSKWLERMRKNPLCRALRVDKVTLAGLEATLRLYRDVEGALAEIPTLRMLAASPEALRRRAEALSARLQAGGVPVAVVRTAGAVGGGTFPGVELDSWAVELRPDEGVDRLASALRSGDPPVVGRIVDDALLLDVRTVLPGQSDALVRRVKESWEARSRSTSGTDGSPA